MEPRHSTALSLIADLLVAASRELDNMGHHQPAAQVDQALLLISEVLSGTGLDQDGAPGDADEAGAAPDPALPGAGATASDITRARANALLENAKLLLDELGYSQAAAFTDMAQLRMNPPAGPAAPDDGPDSVG